MIVTECPKPEQSASVPPQPDSGSSGCPPTHTICSDPGATCWAAAGLTDAPASSAGSAPAWRRNARRLSVSMAVHYAVPSCGEQAEVTMDVRESTALGKPADHFRDYEHAQPRVAEFYRLNHTHQTVAFVHAK